MITCVKKIWSQEEDRVLKLLYEQEMERNWSKLAKRMSLNYGLPRKSAKQCKQRYENHICSEVIKIQWTIQEQLMLIQYHNQIGNKWSVIAQKIPGKTDNCVKNHFYSKLRKVLRKLNAVIHSYFRRQFRQININVIYKMVEATEELFKEHPNCDPSVSLACRQVQNKMFNLSMLKEQQYESEYRLEIYRQAVREINAASKMYKRKSKKTRNNAIQAPNFHNQRKQRCGTACPQEAGYESEQSSVAEGPESEDSRRKPRQNRGHFAEQVPFEIQVARPVKKKIEIVVKDQEQAIKNILADAGLLRFDQSQRKELTREAGVESSREGSVNGDFKFSSKSSFKSYSENNDPQLFDDSDFEKGMFSGRRGSVFGNVGLPSERSEGEGGEQFYIN